MVSERGAIALALDVEPLIDAGCQTCRRHIVTENSVIHDLRAERRLWNQLIHHVEYFPAPQGQRSPHRALHRQK
jgi:hypothetical protein